MILLSTVFLLEQEWPHDPGIDCPVTGKVSDVEEDYLSEIGIEARLT